MNWKHHEDMSHPKQTPPLSSLKVVVITYEDPPRQHPSLTPDPSFNIQPPIVSPLLSSLFSQTNQIMWLIVSKCYQWKIQ